MSILWSHLKTIAHTDYNNTSILKRIMKVQTTFFCTCMSIGQAPTIRV